MGIFKWKRKVQFLEFLEACSCFFFPYAYFVIISGSKNSALALIPIALLSDGVVTIDNVPEVSDIFVLKEILEYLGAKVSFDNNVMVINNSKLKLLLLQIYGNHMLAMD